MSLRRGRPSNFYPRPPRGGRHAPAAPEYGEDIFLSTPSARRATPAAHTTPAWPSLFLSTPSARRATCVLPVPGGPAIFLSTPSARRATQLALGRDGVVHISIHALREEGDRSRTRSSTASRNFYPRPPRGGRPFDSIALAAYNEISIHALREEGDSKNRDKISIFKQIIQHSARI